MRLLILLSLCSALTLTPSLRAHHSFAAEYDANKPITLKGKINKVEWVNPHSWIHVDVTDANGVVTTWRCETAPPNSLFRRGWTRSSLPKGTEVIVEGFRAKTPPTAEAYRPRAQYLRASAAATS